MAVLLAATIVVPGRAYAETVLDYDPTNTVNPVADNITRLNVNKLEKGSRDYVAGSHLAVYEKETGKLVTEWVSDGSVHEIARNTDDPNRGALNIDVVYVLRELSAPDGYALAKDVEFVIHSDDFNTTGEILSGSENGNADSSEIHGSGSEQAFVINLYDESTLELTEEQRITRQREQEAEEQAERQSAEGLTQTGDNTSYLPILALVAAGAGVLVVALIKRKRNN